MPEYFESKLLLQKYSRCFLIIRQTRRKIEKLSSQYINQIQDTTKTVLKSFCDWSKIFGIKLVNRQEIENSNLKSNITDT